MTSVAIKDQLFEVKVRELVPGGQAIGDLPDGRKVFVWNALPGETVRVRLIKSKRQYAEGIAEEVVTPSGERVEPKETNYLATSPWQMMKFDAENRYKNNIVKIQAEQAGVEVEIEAGTTHDDHEWHYRNKMEYSFWGDDEGIHLALYQRGSHGKQIVQGSVLAMPAVDAGAAAIVAQLNQLAVRAGDMKTIVVRASQKGVTVGALFTKMTTFPQLTLPPELAGLRVYHSNPKSPASVPSKLLYELGNSELVDSIGGNELTYDVDSFFQVNVAVFELALAAIKQAMPEGPLVDMYAGVGSIGLALAQGELTLVELDKATAAMARNNSKTNPHTEVIDTSSEQALQYITHDTPVVFDPPRAGLHERVVDQVLEELPPFIAYLSCNPATHMRDLAYLQKAYVIDPIQIFNFFPRTPHIETLALLRRKDATRRND